MKRVLSIQGGGILDLSILYALLKLCLLYQGKNNIFFAGAWNGFGFHEDGVKSALNIANKLKVDLSWIDKNEKSN